MPLFYGEGARALIRLEGKILKSSDDESISAWDFCRAPGKHASLFTSSPDEFAGCAGMLPFTPAGVKPSHYTLTNKGFQC